VSGACKNCSDRHIGCHVTCERYAADCAKRQQINEARRKLKFCEDAEVKRHVRMQENGRSISRRRQGY
jgi:hypothetical protein